MRNINKAIVSGAAGFTGSILVERLLAEGIEVFAIVRPHSSHNNRILFANTLLHIIEMNPEEYHLLPKMINGECDIFFHLMWSTEQGFEGQKKNIDYSINALKSAINCKCKCFICTGSQAEYGIVPPTELTVEDRPTSPITPYGIAKVATCSATKEFAEENNIDWIWGRIFSLIGKNESPERMLPNLYLNLKTDKISYLSSCQQNWDYLDVYDAANALICLGKKGKSGEIYNIANGKYRPLREYTETLHEMISPRSKIVYGQDPNPFISLQPAIKKITLDTGWTPKRSFQDSINDYDAYFKL